MIENLNLLEEIRLILSKVLKIKIEDINMDSSLQDDLGIDSVDFWDIVAGFDKKYRVRITEKEAESLKTVSDMVETLDKKLRKL